MLPTRKDEIRTNLLQSQAALTAPTALRDRYETYLVYADDGNGGDITCNGEPFKTFEEWCAS